MYDAETGNPLADATVTNALNGLSAKSTSTGTLSLFFVDTGGGLLRIAKIGYQPLTLAVANSPADTTPLTVLMSPVAQRLETVHSTARSNRGPADTVRSLELHGFYDRRLTSAAPLSSFVTSDKLERLTLLSDVGTLSGRAICVTNLYVNGARLAPLRPANLGPGRSPKYLARNPVDQLFEPSDVLAVEQYSPGEVPAEYNMTRSPNTTDCGATLIWTK
jgi:hypothetical protein